MNEFKLTEFRLAHAQAGESLRLYIFDEDGYHRGGQWFVTGTKPIKYPDEEIVKTEAQALANAAVGERHEVRITNGLDELVFHAINGKVIYPEGESVDTFFAKL